MAVEKLTVAVIGLLKEKSAMTSIIVMDCGGKWLKHTCTHTQMTTPWLHPPPSYSTCHSFGLHDPLTEKRIHFHSALWTLSPFFLLVLAFVNYGKCFSVSWLAVKLLSDLQQSCPEHRSPPAPARHQTLPCEAAKTAYHVHSWPWEFWKAGLMFN